VVSGAFTADLDFQGKFSGQQRWLEISVNGQLLSPDSRSIPFLWHGMQMSGNAGPAGATGPTGAASRACTSRARLHGTRRTPDRDCNDESNAITVVVWANGTQGTSWKAENSPMAKSARPQNRLQLSNSSRLNLH